MIPFDLTEIVSANLARDRREPDGLLHASSHLLGSERHAQLDVAGAPKITSAVVRDIRLYTGTMWHEWLGAQLQREGVPFMREVDVTPWLPRGWGGKLDYLIFNPEFKAFGLTDLKTIKGDGLRWILKDGPKEEHVYQTSLYWHGAKKMGIPLIKQIGVYYLPMSEARGESPEPLLCTFDPLPWSKIEPIVESRYHRVSDYLASLEGVPDGPLERWVTGKLAPVQERVLATWLNKRTGQYEAQLKPHWSTAYCEYPNELCDCRTQGITKVGEWLPNGNYFPRKGFENVAPPATPASG